MMARTRSKSAISIIFTFERSSLAEAGWRGRARAGEPMPAQQMTPARGLEVDLIQVRVAERAEDIDEVEETSVEVKSVRAESERTEDTEDCGGGLRSRMETFAFWESRRRAVARPRPLDYIHRKTPQETASRKTMPNYALRGRLTPPEMMKVRPWIFIF